MYESKWEGTLDRISLRCITLLSSKKKEKKPAGFDCILLRALFVHNSGI